MFNVNGVPQLLVFFQFEHKFNFNIRLNSEPFNDFVPSVKESHRDFIHFHHCLRSPRILIVSMNPSSCVGQLCGSMFSILILLNYYPLNEAACPPVCTAYSPIVPSEDIYTLTPVH